MAKLAPDRQRSDAIGRLFAKLTVEFEHAHELSVIGQNARLNDSRRRALLLRLRRRLACCDSVLAELAPLLQQ